MEIIDTPYIRKYRQTDSHSLVLVKVGVVNSDSNLFGVSNQSIKS